MPLNNMQHISLAIHVQKGFMQMFSLLNDTTRSVVEISDTQCHLTDDQHKVGWNLQFIRLQ